MAKKLKRWYHSKTILTNIAGALLGIIPVLDINFLTLIGVSDPARYYGVLGGIAAILNILYRTQSDTPTPPIKTKARTQKLD